jgi:hypothetical protein
VYGRQMVLRLDVGCFGCTIIFLTCCETLRSEIAIEMYKQLSGDDIHDGASASQEWWRML